MPRQAEARESGVKPPHSIKKLSLSSNSARIRVLLYLRKCARRAMKAIPRCKPYRVDLPIQAKKQHLVFDGSAKPKLVTKQGTIPDALHLLDF